MLMSARMQKNNEYAAWVSAMAGALAAGDADDFDSALAGFEQVRGAEVTQQVRRVAIDLQTALDDFRIDSKLIDLAQRQVPDARHRLSHVLRLTDDAAHRTMDLVERCCPLADQTAQEAQQLLASHAADGSLPALTPQITGFLQRAGVRMAAVRSNLGEVLLAQGYQDISGQIIRGVMTLVSELEEALGQLVRIGGPMDEAQPATETLARGGHGPVVPGISHGHAVSGQQDVDALLSDLGM
jgi:chemotaxis protein CheZ